MSWTHDFVGRSGGMVPRYFRPSFGRFVLCSIDAGLSDSRFFLESPCRDLLQASAALFSVSSQFIVFHRCSSVPLAINFQQVFWVPLISRASSTTEGDMCFSRFSWILVASAFSRKPVSFNEFHRFRSPLVCNVSELHFTGLQVW